MALARGRLNRQTLTDVQDPFVSDVLGGSGTAASRVVFGADDRLFMTIGRCFWGLRGAARSRRW